MDQHDFLIKLSEKFPEKNLFTNAKNQMKKAKFKYERVAVYSRVYRDLPVNQRKVLAHFRDKGVLPNPTPLVNSPRTTRRKNVESKFNNYWSKLTKNNRNTVRNYVARHKSPSPVKAKSPVFSTYLKNINALKTAKARAEWLKARKLNLKPEKLKVLKQYVKNMNQVNRNRRDAKRKK